MYVKTDIADKTIFVLQLLKNRFNAHEKLGNDIQVF